MTIDFEDYNGNYIATIITNEIPNLMDYDATKIIFNKYFNGNIIIKKIYDIVISTIRYIVRIDYRILNNKI